MSTYYGDDAIVYLAEKSQQIDIKSSSHWNKYHANFSFKNGEFSASDNLGLGVILDDKLIGEPEFTIM